MKGFIAAAIMLAGLTAPAVAAKVEITRGANYPKTVAGQVIVELAAGATIGARDLDNVDVHARFFEELDKRLPNKFTVGKKFASEVFTGASLTLKSIDDVKAIAATKGVLSVRPVTVYDRPEVIKSELPKLDKPDQFPPNIMTGADKIHATGNIGKGIKVGIIDSGIDYTHPALGGGFGPGFKVAGGWDFVGDDYVPGATPVPDADPLDQCGGHGTHVAGIIAADPNNPFSITGVAYGATLHAYRIFGCGGGVTDEIIVDSLIRAYNEGNDVITLSLGGLDGWTASSSSVVASRISRAGRVVTIAAGNSGAEGLWYTSSPGNGIDVISVGSVDNIAVGPLYTVTTTAPGLGPFPYQWDGSLEPLPVGNIALPVYATSKDPTVVDDACSALPASTPDLSGYVTLIRRGTCNFTIKIQNAVSKGAKVILLYNNGGNWGAINVGGYQTAAIVDTASGEAILAAVNAGTNFTVSFPTTGTTTVPNVATGGLVSTFSSYGPTYDLYFKPAVSAPGGQILGTYPVPLGSYAVLSGTSMATPHTAGIAALILKAKGKGAAKGIRDLLQTTSTYLPSTLEEGAIPQTLAAGGAGLANVYNALTYTTVVTPGQLLLNDTANWKGLQTFWIKNTGKKAKTYTLKHIPAGAVNSFYDGSIQPQDGPVPVYSAAATVKLSLSKAIVLPGTSLPIIVNVQPPKGVDASVVPVISGHIEVATAGEILKVSYLGVATDLKKVQIVDNSGDLLGVPTPALIDAIGNIQEEPTSYTFAGEDYPLLIFRLVFGTRKIAVDLVKADATIPTNLRVRGLPSFHDWIGGLIGGWFPSQPGTGTYAKVPIVGKLSEYEYLPRNNNADDPYYQVAVPGAFVNGTAIPVGSYKVLVRALKVGGNAANQDHYETWLSPVVNVVAA